MSWESSQHYYQIINRAVQDRLGGVHSARRATADELEERNPRTVALIGTRYTMEQPFYGFGLFSFDFESCEVPRS